VDGREGRGGEGSRGEGKGKVVLPNVRDALTPLAIDFGFKAIDGRRLDNAKVRHSKY